MTNAELLASIVLDYRPYDSLDAFGEGFVAHARRSFVNPYDGDESAAGQVSAQAWDRGLECAARYKRALAGVPDPAPQPVAIAQRTGKKTSVPPVPSLLAKLMGRAAR